MKPIYSFLFLFALAYTSLGQTIWGCTDPTAQNYNSEANTDAGNCCYTNYLTFTGGNVYAAFYWSANGLYLSYYPGLDVEPGVCVTEGCITVQISPNSPGYTDMTFYLNGEVLDSFTSDELYLAEGIIILSVGETEFGCTDQYACNYNPLATCEDQSCYYSCYGCTNPESYNYDPEALIDDGSCCSAENYMTLTTDAADGNSFEFYIFSSYTGYYITGSEGSTFCLPEGCYEIYPYDYFDPNAEPTIVNVTITDANGDIVFQTPLSNNTQQGVSFAYNAIAGCTETFACNYDPSATCNDGSCDYSCLGCTNPEAANFDPDATIDDGTCCDHFYCLSAVGSTFDYSIYTNGQGGASGYYPELSAFCLADGCINFDIWADASMTTIPFDWQLLDEEGNVVASGTVTEPFGGNFQIGINVISGCSNPTACNYNPEANCDDYQTCVYNCYGCTDPAAPNYDPDALYDDGTCCTDDWYVLESEVAGYFQVYNQNGNGIGGQTPEDNGFCMPEGCFSLMFYPMNYSNTDFTIQLISNGEVIGTATFDPLFGGANIQISNGEVIGCLDAGACNYNAEATCGDYTLCDYGCYGCTNPDAPNYDPGATLDNGTCCTNSWYTIEMSAPGYWSTSSLVDYNYGYGYYPDQNGFCVDGECVQFYAWSYDGSPITYTIYDENGNEISTGESSSWGMLNVITGEGYVTGCADMGACNYDPNVTCPDYYACDYSCYGCTDPTAANYDEAATIDNGLCCTTTWYNVTMSGSAYWSIGSINYQYAGGMYPDQDGFCFDGTCFSIMVYPLETETVEYSITSSDGTVIFSGIAYPFSYQFTSVSLTDEVAGCTEVSACNYNPEATCEDGSCTYYCGGCTDSEALNYNPQALFDDGSCFYSADPPNMGMAMMPDEENNQFWVIVNVTDEGNGSPYLLRSDFDDATLLVNAPGEYLAGPYPCNVDVAFELQSMTAGLATYMNTTLEGACALTNDTEDISVESNQLSIYPNPNNGRFVINGITASRARIQITDVSGRIVMDETMNVSSDKVELNTEELTNGIYQVSVISFENVHTTRMIVRK